MHDLDHALLDAWRRIEPILRDDPAELSRRLARRRTSMMLRPPRAWCLAVRASDTRINEASAVIVPDWALYPHLNPYHRNRYAVHEVTLDTRLLKRLCVPVHIEPPGEDWLDVAKKLGVSGTALHTARLKGVFEVRYIKGLGGKCGKPVPVLYSPRTFDPSARNFWSRPDAIFGGMWTQLTDLLPPDLSQTIERDPEYKRMTRARTKNRRSIFMGWRWRCPGCRRRVKTIYLPLPPINIPTFFGLEKRRAEIDAIPTPPLCFACGVCHRVQNFTRLKRQEWNHLIAHLSGALLYGHEVERPAWLTKDRKHAYHPHVMRAPSKRREEVLERLLKGMSRKEIAKDLGIAPRTVKNHARTIYAQHRVKNRFSLAKQLGKKLEHRHPRRDQVRRLMAAGKNYKQIALAMEITKHRVWQHMADIRREAGNRLTAKKCFATDEHR